MMALEVDMVEAKSVAARNDRNYSSSYEVAADFGSSAGESQRGRSLVERLKAGDSDAFDAIFHQHVNQIYRKALRLLGNEADAEDVVQEVFLTVHKKVKTFRGECELSTWLYRLTVNAALGRLRRQKRSKEVLYEDYLPKFQKDGHHLVRPVVDWSDKVGDGSDQRELQQLLKQALEQLKPVDKAVVVLSDLEGYLDREIANTLGLSVAAVKTRLHRSRLFLRGKLAVHLGYSPA
jgi:RNA polymerase sigma-70 factor, ECF subfamily